MAALDEWLAASPANREEYERLSALLMDLDGLRSHPEIMAMREEAHGLSWRRYAAVVSVLCLMVGAVFALGTLQLGSPSSSASGAGASVTTLYETPEGRTAMVTLTDGSLVHLDASSAVRVRMDGVTRRVALMRGRAYFAVVPDPAHPFIVLAGGRTVTALGTRFDVNLLERGFEVVLAEGRVQVRPERGAGDAASAITMTPGYRLAADRDGWSLDRIDLAAQASWRTGMLVFEEARLGDIVVEMNRYVTTKITIPSQAVADRRMSAVLKAGDLTTFLSAVRAIGIANWSRAADGSYQLTDPSPQKNLAAG
jgi:transmembrane sensor